MRSAFLQKSVQPQYDYLAPDGSEIRLLSRVGAGGVCHCSLPPGKMSSPVKHKTVEEIWYFISGTGEMWQREENEGHPFAVKAGDSVNIPAGNSFQFKNTGADYLRILIVTMPNWPGEDEAVHTEGYW